MSDLSHETNAIITACCCNSSGERVSKKTSNTEVSYEDIQSQKNYMTRKSGYNIKWLCSSGELNDRWDIRGLGKVLENTKT